MEQKIFLRTNIINNFRNVGIFQFSPDTCNSYYQVEVKVNKVNLSRIPEIKIFTILKNTLLIQREKLLLSSKAGSFSKVIHHKIGVNLNQIIRYTCLKF